MTFRILDIKGLFFKFLERKIPGHKEMGIRTVLEFTTETRAIRL